ncbi:hypothetical protein VZT92_024644 [Zoarces viviparus]|uniref:Uncharacterized protein n=1 Tax=Zoarces viviparus TaxID=48416 RepID=A0AAW1E3E0_ZOAVI
MFRCYAEIWQTLDPKFAVHLGVTRGSSVVFLEQTGKNSGYRDKDVCGFCPGSHCCVEGGPEKLDSVVTFRPPLRASFTACMDQLEEPLESA